MHSIGVHLEGHLAKGLLKVLPSRPTAYGLETHLVSMHKQVEEFRPDVVIVDPITNLASVGTSPEAQSMMTRLIDFLKIRGTTSFFTSLTSAGEEIEESEIGISSLVDSWLLLAVLRGGGERNRTLTIIKSRGMAHSNQAAEYRLTDGGLEIVDTYLGAAGVLTGSARKAKEAEDAAAIALGSEEIARKEQERERRRRATERQIAELREQLEADDAALTRDILEASRRRERLGTERTAMGLSRQAFAPHRTNGGRSSKERDR